MDEQENEQAEAQSPDTNLAEEAAESLRALVESTNIALSLDDEELEAIGKECKEGFDRDLQSREEWEEKFEEWSKLALQVKEEKAFPWANAANVKYPLLSIASMQFNARAYPSLVPATQDLVKCEVIGKDPDGMKLEKAKRIGTYMSYQILNKMEGWEEDMDKLLIILPIIGTVFKKTYYDSVCKTNCSELVMPKNLVVNYWAKSLEDAERVSEIIEMPKRILKEKQMGQIYRDIDLADPVPMPQEDDARTPSADDTSTPYAIIEQHRYYDMDEDGYAEPYIVTFERYSGKVLRIVARFDNKSIDTIVDSKGKTKLAKITPIQYYTKFGFIPNPEGGFYDIGFGLLLAPLNESVNTLINQLIDAGTLANLQAGFLGKGIKIRAGEQRFQPGEWKTVQSTTDDLRKQIMALPTKDPSEVLFKLMDKLMTSGKELASVAEIFVGKMPGQNTPATTTMATIEQGMKVFTAVYKRVYRALRSEFKKLFELNGVYLDSAEYQKVVDMPIDPADFNSEDYDVCPGADPNTATSTEKLMKAQGLMEMLPTGVLDVVEVVRRNLEAHEIPSYERLFSQAVQQTGQPAPPPPDPKVLALQMKQEADDKKAQMDMQNDSFKRELDARDQIFQQHMEAQKQQQDARHEQVMGMLKARSTHFMDETRIASAQQAHVQDMVHNEQSHAQDMAHQEEVGKLKIQQAKAMPKPPSKTGKSSK